MRGLNGLFRKGLPEMTIASLPGFNKRTTKSDKIMVTLKDLQHARALLRGVAVRTPLVECRLDGNSIFIKPENLQPIGSFKLRGAYNKISSLAPEERRRGVVAHSSGNHAQG